MRTRLLCYLFSYVFHKEVIKRKSIKKAKREPEVVQNPQKKQVLKTQQI